MPLVNYKLGKTPARNAVSLKFSMVFNAAKLPTPPLVFGHENLMADGNWFGLGNDRVGDCVFAGAAHEHMLWTMVGGQPRSRFTTADVLSDYAAVTGFDPAKPETDQGTDMQVAAAYRQKTGIRDALGIRHKIDAYAALRAGDTAELALATWLFGATGCGFNIPSSAEAQFEAGQPWTIVPSDSIEGGHYNVCVGRNSDGNFLFISWGRVQAATPAWVGYYMDEGLSYLSMESLNSSTKMTPEGFSYDVLQEYLKGLSQ